jgi:hypothetical protein
VEFITDVDFAADKLDTATLVTFVANIGAGTRAPRRTMRSRRHLPGRRRSSRRSLRSLAGTCLAIDQASPGAFNDIDDLLLDITGAAGTIGSSNFI